MKKLRTLPLLIVIPLLIAGMALLQSDLLNANPAPLPTLASLPQPASVQGQPAAQPGTDAPTQASADIAPAEIVADALLSDESDSTNLALADPVDTPEIVAEAVASVAPVDVIEAVPQSQEGANAAAPIVIAPQASTTDAADVIVLEQPVVPDDAIASLPSNQRGAGLSAANNNLLPANINDNPLAPSEPVLVVGDAPSGQRTQSTQAFSVVSRAPDGTVRTVSTGPTDLNVTSALATPLAAPDPQPITPLPIADTREELLDMAQAQGSVPVIVTLDVPELPQGTSAVQNLDYQQQIDSAQQNVLNNLSSTGVTLNAMFQYTPAIALTVDAAALEALYQQPGVLRVQQDALDAPLLADSNTLIGTDNVRNVLGYTGDNMAVAILDSGVQLDHPFFRDAQGNSRIVAEACYNNGGGGGISLCPEGVKTSTAPGSGDDCLPYQDPDTGIRGCGHGTHVAGIAAGSDLGDGFSGVAPDAAIIAMNVFTRFDSAGSCGAGQNPCILSYRSDQMLALERVLTLQPTLAQQGITIASVNMSLGGGSYTSTCDNDDRGPLVRELTEAGIAVVIASGNNGYLDRIHAPGCIEAAITVGATQGTTNDNDAYPDDAGDNLSTYSNTSAVVDVLAPGDSIQSSYVPSNYALISGTSMATPHVAGSVALIRGALTQNNADPAANQVVGIIRTALVNTGTPITDERSRAINNNVETPPRITTPRINVPAAIGELFDCPDYSFPVTIPATDTAGLIEALEFARDESCFPGSDTINLTEGTYTVSQPYNNSDAAFPPVDTPVVINGNGATIERSGASEAFRLFEASADLTLNNLTLKGGAIDATSASQVGGALGVLAGTTTANNVTFQGNTSSFFGGAVFVDDDGTFVGKNSVFFLNEAEFGAALANEGAVIWDQVVADSNTAGDSGTIYSTGTTNLLYSAFTNNAAVTGGGLDNRGMMTIVGTQFSGNRALYGAAIANSADFADLTVINSSIFDNEVTFNSATNGGSAFNQWDPSEQGENPGDPVAHIHSSTIVQNRSQSPNGAIFLESSDLFLYNTILSGNTSSAPTNPKPECSIAGGTLHLNANNIVGVNGSVTVCPVGATDIVPTGPLSSIIETSAQDNGGLRLTFALAQNSPARDAGNASLLPQDALDLDSDGDTTEAIPWDQRGPGFPRRDSLLDIGAYEVDTWPRNIADGDVDALVNAITSANDENNHPGVNVIDLTPNGVYVLETVADNLDGPSGLPSITSEVIINGNGATIRRSGVNGTPAMRIVRVGSPGNLTLNDITLADGVTDTSQNNGAGGLWNSGTATLNNVTLTGHDESAIRNEGSLTLYNSRITDSSGAFGGAINNFDDTFDADAGLEPPANLPQQGRGIRTQPERSQLASLEADTPLNNGGPQVTLVNTQINNNSVSNVGGGIWNGGQLNAYNSAFWDNRSEAWGGAIYNDTGDVRLIGTTLSGNQATGALSTQGGGAVNQFSELATFEIVNSTITGNSATQAANSGIFIEFGSFTSRNSIIAGNGTDGDCNILPEATFISGGYNLFGDESDAGGCPVSGTDLVPSVPLAAILADRTPEGYHPLVAASPAIDAGSNDALPTDAGDVDNDDDTSESLPIDPAGNARRSDDANVPDSGLPGALGAPVVDIGAMEWQGESCAEAGLYTIADGDVAGLIAAINCANTQAPFDGEITLATDGTYTLTEAYANGYGLPQLQANITLQGNGATLQRSDLDQTPAFALLHIANGANITINDLLLTNGVGATLQNDVLAGGAVFNEGTLTVNRSTFSSHQASALRNLGSLTVSDSTFTGNTGDFGAAINTYGAGVGSETYIERSTFSANIGNVGGALYNDALAFLTNSTLHGNNATLNGGGVYNASNGTTIITHSTLASNSAANAGANVYSIAGGVRFRNTLLADPQNAANCAFSVGDSSSFGNDGGNLEEATSGSCGFGPADVLADAGLVTDNDNTPLLANNGGPTLTVALAPFSPAEDRVPANNCFVDLNRNGAKDTNENVVQDQRGVERPQQTLCDSGAFEQNVQTCPVDSFSLQTASTAELLEAFNCAQQHAGDSSYTVTLLADATYNLDAAHNTFDGPNGLPVIQNSVVVVGQNATLERSSDPQTPDFRFFMVDEGAELTVSNLTLRNGRSATTTGGGAVRNSGDATFTRVTFEGNTGSAIRNENTLTVNESYFTGNSSPFGAGINAFDDGVPPSALELPAEVDQLVVPSAPSSADAPVSTLRPYTVIENSTFAENSASTAGSGVYIAGQALITNSSFVKNAGAAAGGGLYMATGSQNMLTNLTLTANQTDLSGANLYVLGAATIRNSIVADPRDGANCLIVGGTLTDGGGNLEQAQTSASCGFAAEDFVSDAGLSYSSGEPVLNMSGIVPFVALSSDSVAIDRVPEGNCFVDVNFNAVADDGEGLDRDQPADPRPMGDACDSGADEAVGDALAVVELQFVDLNGTPGIAIDEQFQIDFYVYDSRDNEPAFSAFMDVEFDPTRVRVDEIIHDSEYIGLRTGEIKNDEGLVDEVGATQGISGSSDAKVFSLRVTALQNGLASFTTNPGEDVRSEVLLSEPNPQDRRNETDYGTLTLTVGSSDPDLLLTNFDATPDHVHMGTTTISYTLANEGASDAPAFDAAVYLSADATCEPGTDTLITVLQIAGITTGQSISDTIAINLPRATLYAQAKVEDLASLGGTHQSTSAQYLCMVADSGNAVAEGNEENNRNRGQGLDVDDITYFPWDTDENGVITPTEALSTIQEMGRTDAMYDFDGSGIVTPTEALDIILRQGYSRNTAVDEGDEQAGDPTPLPDLPIVPRAAAARVQLEIVELDDTPGLVAGEAFNLNVRVLDAQSGAAVFSGFVDLQFDPTLLRADGIRYAEGFEMLQSGQIDNTRGLINDLGAASSGLSANSDTLVAIVRMTALQTGDAQVSTSSADALRAETTVFSLAGDQRHAMQHATLNVGVSPIFSPTRPAPTLPVPPERGAKGSSGLPIQAVNPQPTPSPLPPLPVPGR